MQRIVLASNFPYDLQSGHRSLGGLAHPCRPPFSVSIGSIHQVMVFLCLSADGIRFWDGPVPTDAAVIGVNGIATFHTGEIRLEEVRSILRVGCLAAGQLSVPAHDPVLPSSLATIPAIRIHEASSSVHVRSPIQSFLNLDCADGSHAPSAFPRASHLAVTSNARRG